MGGEDIGAGGGGDIGAGDAAIGAGGDVIGVGAVTVAGAGAAVIGVGAVVTGAAATGAAVTTDKVTAGRHIASPNPPATFGKPWGRRRWPSDSPGANGNERHLLDTKKCYIDVAPVHHGSGSVTWELCGC
jgi:hypothetical protein